MDSPSLSILIAINRSTDNAERAKSVLLRCCKQLSFLDPVPVFLDSMTSYEDYQRFCVKQLPSYFFTDFVLTIQLDGYVLDPKRWTDEFFEYDYIGAPWPLYPWLAASIKQRGKSIYDENQRIGNGGFSLRSHMLCKWIAENSQDFYPSRNEDVYLCCDKREAAESMGFKFAPYTVAHRFSIEKEEYSGQFGAHDEVLVGGRPVDLRIERF